ncbi:S1/P1 nuclease [Moheibacter sediminis]|uniref:S1/P1 Nuclease n=1 Tax=Moheibacter sediminis TaxID=1434700 RepID=A0A1W1YCS1_9FLAO|nr:S1/P1 nuclease [Moheibacter sediminis]SMC34020.1 S1/P1 Nuclease [Moheibacter sediminis]
MKNLTRFLVLTIFLFATIQAYAWGTTGHRVVAEIAENHLSNKAKKQLKKIIGEQPLAYWANWGDFVKSNPDWKMADSWHYINFPSGLSQLDFEENLNNSSDENLYKRSLIIIDELKNNKNLSLQKKQENLYFLIHLIGDAHQPLHIGREEDLGGNKIQVEWFRDQTNLHSLWDTKLVDFQNYSYTEYAEVLDFHDKKFNQNLTHGNLNNWLFDSYQKAEIIYNNAKSGDKLSYKYNYDNVSMLEEQLLKGGLRLAKVLNHVFD